MLHSSFSDKSFRPKFSGHETFPLRYNWLSKMVAQKARGRPPQWMPKAPVEQAMVRFGVGKNMVRSMCHWAELCDVADVEPEKLEVKLTPFGRRVISERDPYLEDAGTIWALHWQVATRPHLATTWYWMFNGFPSSVFDARSAAEGLRAAAATHGWRIPATGTIERDVDCFLRCYTVSRAKKGTLTEDSLECPFAELELVQPAPERGFYEFQRGPKPTLPDAVFAFALSEFWACTGGDTLSFEHVAHAPGSPGRVFKLDETSVAERLERVEDASAGTYRWIDTAGLRQVQRVKSEDNPLEILVRGLVRQTQVEQ